MGSAGPVDVLAGDLVAAVDRGRPGRRRPTHIDPAEPAAPVEKEAVLELEGRRVAPVGVRTDDAAPVVDPGGEGSSGAGEVDLAKAAPLAEESVEPLSRVEVGAGDLPAIVAPVCRGEQCPGHVDLGEASGVAHEALAARALTAATEHPISGACGRRSGECRSAPSGIRSNRPGAETEDAARAAAEKTRGCGCVDRRPVGGGTGGSRHGNDQRTNGQRSGYHGAHRRWSTPASSRGGGCLFSPSRVTLSNVVFATGGRSVHCAGSCRPRYLA